MAYKRFKLMVLCVLFISATLSGCVDDEEDTTPLEEKSDLEISHYEVETQQFNLDKSTYEKIADGFTYNDAANRYLVSGTVMNNGTKNISKAYVYVNFYDKDDTLLLSRYDMIFQLAPNETKDFAADFTKYDGQGFSNVNHVKFSFTIEYE